MSGAYDVCVVGGGSGGFGAALAAARLGLSVVLIEKGEWLGGTSTRGGVNVWERGTGGTGIPFDLYRRLNRVPGAIGISSTGRHGCWYNAARDAFQFPGGEQIIDPSLRYLDTLCSHGKPEDIQGYKEAFVRPRYHALPFEPGLMAGMMAEMLQETGRCEVRLNRRLREVRAAAGRVLTVELDDGSTVEAGAYVDGTADGVLCLAAGCEVMTGQESRDRFGEPDAPAVANARVNGVTLCYRVARADTPGIEPLGDGIPAACWWRKSFPWTCMTEYPCGDRNLNALPLMEGGEFLQLGPKAAYAECCRRVRAHWHHLQEGFEEFRGFRLRWVAPALGVRESSRIVGEYVLTELDLMAGMSRQTHPDIIGVADHPMDSHSESGGGCRGLAEPYGVPFRCLVPKGYQNLLVACRAASFSSLAASSCRLSRTMMQLGQAAGTAIALAQRHGVTLPEVPCDELRARLRDDHALVDWPMPDELVAHLLAE